VKDLLEGCNEFGISERDFKNMFCVRCKNPECVNAGHAETAWLSRMLTQEGIIFNPIRAEEDDPRYRDLRLQEFKDLANQALKVFISGIKNDWTPPEDINLDDESSVDILAKRFASSPGESLVAPESPPPKPPPLIIPGLTTELPKESASPVQNPPELASPTKIKKPFNAKGGNTSRESRVLGDAPDSVQPADDPWAPPKKVETHQGNTYRFGSKPNTK